MSFPKIVVTGAAGLVGQNLITRLVAKGYDSIVAIDKNQHNLDILSRLHPTVVAVHADLAESGKWEEHFANCEVLVHGQAQIGGLVPDEFVRNNIRASDNIMRVAKAVGVKYIVNISSSVVNSMAVDDYTETKKAQEKLVLESEITQVVLRPTLMFGWFDRKHMGWLAHFMKRVPVFPIPGSGKYLRQPLYVGDFCNVIISAIEKRVTGAYNISGQERIDYIDLMRSVRDVSGARAMIVKIPYSLFSALLGIYAIVDRNPPFTQKQLKALSTPDVFEVINWGNIFGITPTPLKAALNETFNDPTYSQIELKF